MQGRVSTQIALGHSKYYNHVESRFQSILILVVPVYVSKHHENIYSIQYLKQAFLGPIALVTIVGLPRAPMARILFPSLARTMIAGQ